MPLKIRYLNGPYAGRDIDIEDSVGEVRFGRGLDADIPFPEEMTAVSRQHFGLRKEYGGYKFIINREKPVFMDGRSVFDDQDLPRSCEIQLSATSGPRLKIERIEAHAGNLAKTEILNTAQDMAGAVAAQSSAHKRTRGSLALVAVLLVAAAVGGWFVWKGTEQQIAANEQAVVKTQQDVAAARNDVASLKDELPSIKSRLSESGKAVDFTTVIERVKSSVYLIATESPEGALSPAGTAFVVTMPDGTKVLGTNAHVADIFNELKKPEAGGRRLVAIEPKAPDYRRAYVTGVRKHPAYDQWAAFSEAYYQKAEAGLARSVSLPVGYDVALLFVEKPDQLGTPLRIAAQPAMENLKAGQSIVQLGYPAEHVLGTDPARPEPNSNVGLITSMTSFFLSVGDVKDRQFIQHNAMGAGGSSGSAIIDSNGDLIGLHNSGNYIFIKTGPNDGDYERVPASANLNYAQRADLLVELMEGRAEERTEKIYKPMWAEAERQYSKTPEAIVADQIAALGHQAGGADKVVEWKTLAGEMMEPSPLLDDMRGVFFDLDPEPGYFYLILATSDDQRPIGTAVFRKADDSFFGAGTRGAFMSSYWITYDAAMPARLAVFDDYYAKGGVNDIRPAGKVAVKIYRAPIPGYVPS